MEDNSQVSALDQRDADRTEGMERLLYRLPIVNSVQFTEVFCKKYCEKLFSNFYSVRNARIVLKAESFDTFCLVAPQP